MNEVLFNLVLAIVAVICTAIARFVIPYIKSLINLKNLEEYKKWANLAVRCAEMVWSETGHGADKKQYVVDFLNNLFNAKKIVITEDQLNILIESAVQQLKNGENVENQ